MSVVLGHIQDSSPPAENGALNVIHNHMLPILIGLSVSLRLERLESARMLQIN